MITINWIIERLLVKPTEGSLTDVVITADWRCNGSQDQYSGTCYGSTSFAPPSGSFTPYPDLTEAQVLGWCFASGVDKTASKRTCPLRSLTRSTLRSSLLRCRGCLLFLRPSPR